MDEENKFEGKEPGTEGNAGGAAMGAESTPRPAQGVGATIAERLSQGASGEQARSDEPHGKEALPFDVTKLNYEQLQYLKAALTNIPDRASGKLKNPITKLREMNGNIIVDYKNSYLALLDDPENHRKVEGHMIPVRFLGTEVFVNVRWQDFMHARQIECEIVEHTQKPGVIVEGQVWSKERGTLVEMEVKTMHHFFKVKLPDGQLIDIDGKVSNA